MSDVTTFYNTKGGEKLIETENYPEAIKRFLVEESSKMSWLIHQEKKYTALFEIGCMSARNIHLAIDARIDYYGIDLVDRFINEANASLLKMNLPIKFKVGCQSCTELNSKNTPVPESITPIAFFPFNCFGNIDQPIRAISALSELEYDIAISTYKTDANSTNIRNVYYENCGYSHIVTKNTPEGIVFSSPDGLHTTAYSKQYLEKLSKQFNYELVSYPTCEIGVIYFMKFKR